MKSLFLPVVVCISLVGCGGVSGSAGGATSQPPVPPAVIGTPLSIDNTGIIPAFTDAAVSTEDYVHNNTNQDISVTYSYVVNTADGVGSSVMAAGKSAAKGSLIRVGSNAAVQQVVVVKAGSVVALKINIPQLSGNVTGGAALITANYTYNGKPYTFNQLINFQVEAAENNPGVHLTSGAISSAYNNTTAGYTTLYAYGGGTGGSSNSVDKVLLDPVLGSISQGAIEGSKIASRQVVAMELQTLVVNKSSVGSVEIDSSAGSVYSSIQKVAVLAPAGNNGGGGVIVPSIIPEIITAGNNNSQGTEYLYNAGTFPAEIGVPQFKGSISVGSNSCSGTLNPGNACILNFAVTGVSGSGSMVMPYTTGGIAKQTPSVAVSWDVNSNTVQVNIPDTILSGSNSLQSGIATVTVTNTTGSSVTFGPPGITPLSGGHATLVAITGPTDSCTGESVSGRGGTCSFQVQITDNTIPDIGSFNVQVSGSGASGSGIANYTTSAPEASIAISSKLPQLSIIGNNADSESVTVNIVNTSPTPINSLQVNFNPDVNGILAAGTSHCDGKPLGPQGSESSVCTEILTLLPQTLSSGSASTGSAGYTAMISGQSDSIVTESTGLLILPADNALELNAIVAVGSKAAGGNGSSHSSSITFQAGNPANKSVTFTYKNVSAGGESITITGIQFGTQNSSWDVESGSSCFNGNQVWTNKILAGNDSCTIILDNDLYKVGDSNPVTNMNIPFPEVVLTVASTPVMFTPHLNSYPANKYYVTNQQAIITNTEMISDNGNADAGLHLTHTVTGYSAGGYNGISLTSQITPGADLLLPTHVQDNCGRVMDNGALTETCTLSSDNEAISVVYPINYGIGGMGSTAENIDINYFDNLLDTEAFAYLNSSGGINASGNNEASDILLLKPLANMLIKPRS